MPSSSYSAFSASSSPFPSILLFPTPHSGISLPSTLHSPTPDFAYVIPHERRKPLDRLHPPSFVDSSTPSANITRQSTFSALFSNRQTMQDHQWVHPEGLSSAGSPLSFTSGTPTHDASLFNYAPSHHHHRPSTSSGYHMINPSGLGRSSSGIYVGGMGGLTTVAPTAIPPPVAVEKPLVPVFGGDSGRGRPKSKNPKAKPQGLGTERKARKKLRKRVWRVKRAI